MDGPSEENGGPSSSVSVQRFLVDGGTIVSIACVCGQDWSLIQCLADELSSCPAQLIIDPLQTRCGGNFDQSATVPHLHHNTVRHRLARIAELTGYELPDVAIRSTCTPNGHRNIPTRMTLASRDAAPLVPLGRH